MKWTPYGASTPCYMRGDPVYSVFSALTVKDTLDRDAPLPRGATPLRKSARINVLEFSGRLHRKEHRIDPGQHVRWLGGGLLMRASARQCWG